MLGGKAGILHCHLGDGPRRLEYFFRLVRETEIPPTQVMPTHINRNRELFEEGIRWIEAGGFGRSHDRARPRPRDRTGRLHRGVRPHLQGAEGPHQPVHGELGRERQLPGLRQGAGRLVRLTIASEKDLFRKFRDLVRKGLLGSRTPSGRSRRTPPISTSSTARAGSPRARTRTSSSSTRSLGLDTVIAGGRTMMRDGKLLARGTFSA